MPDVADVPLTRTVSFGSSVESSIGASVNGAVPLVEPAGIVSTTSCTTVKSSPASAVPPEIESVTVAAVSRAAAFSVPVTVTVCADPVAPSDMAAGDTVSVTWFDVASSSVIVSVTGSGCTIARSFAAAPETVTCRFGWSTSLSMALILTVPVLVVAPAAMVSVVPLCA